jgi:hypothetical protein
VSYELQLTSYEILDASYELRDTRYKIAPAPADDSTVQPCTVVSMYIFLIDFKKDIFARKKKLSFQMTMNSGSDQDNRDVLH